MANTGNQIVVTLKKKNLTTGVLTGESKPNVPGDPDYIPPGADAVACPVSTALACPLVKAAKKGAADAVYEFSLPESVLANPAFKKLEVVLKNGAAVVATHTYVVFNPNYFSGTFTALPAGATYTVNLVYKDITDTQIHACNALASVTLDSVITWEALDPACQTYPTCASGWTLDSTGTQCEQVTTMAPNAPTGGGGTPGTAIAATNNQWNQGGARVYQPGWPLSGDGTLNVALTTPHLWVNGAAMWDAGTRNFVDSRMNASGVWVASNPTNEWVGFARQITTPVSKTVFIGMAADNKFRFALNGTDIVNNSTGNINGGPNFNYWNVYPVTLLSGVNYIEMYGLNVSSAGGFGVEIYDCTLAQLQAVTTEAELNAYIIFSSRDVRGESFDLGVTVGYNCNAGYVLDNSDPDPANWTCKQITRTPPTLVNSGLKEWQNRRRLASGVPDGYSEANDIDGIGPYFEPVEDHATCPLPAGSTHEVCITPVLAGGAVTFYATDGAPFSVPNNVVIEWIYSVDGGSWVVAPDQTVLNGTNSSGTYAIPGWPGGGSTIEVVILSFTPDKDGANNYKQCA